MATPRIVKRQQTVPGMTDNNLNGKALQQFIKSQIYMMGFTNAVNTGANVALNNISNFGGAARRLYGLAIWVSQANIADDDTFSMTINNEVIITNAYWRTFCPAYNLKLEQYFPLPRPLSGSDVVQMTWTAVNNKTVYPVFYLSQVADPNK